MTTTRRTALLLAGALILTACSGSAASRRDGTGSSGSGAPASASASSQASGIPDEAQATTTAVQPSKSQREVDALLQALGPLVPIPEDARRCLAQGVAKDPALVNALRRTTAETGPPNGVMDLAAGCMQELHALPAFLDGLETSVDGGLSEGERSCAEKGFRSLDPEVLEAALADALGATRGVEPAGEIKSMLRRCGVKVGG